VVLFDIPWILAIPIGFIGFYLPKFYVKRLQKKRVNTFNDQLVDGLSMMANALRSGSSFLQSLDLVGRELPAPIGEEFTQVVAEVGVGMPIDDALRGLTERVKSYDLYLCVTAMVVQRQTGGNLAEVLENISNIIRERIKLLRQVEVMSAEERFSAMIVGLIPVLILVILMFLNPNYHGPFLETTIGKVIFGVAGTLQLLGFWLMQKVAQIDV
jgi:tight adherence protein B